MITNAARRNAGQERQYSDSVAQQARRRLQHERAARLGLLTTLDKTAHHEVDELLIGQRHATRRTLEEIDAALRRLDDGTYWICPGCREPIPVKRLEILPYARFCVSCQRRRG
jgi:RNA polymerase-binding transcription factor DksA